MGRLGQRKRILAVRFSSEDSDLVRILWSLRNGWPTARLGSGIESAHRIVVARKLGRTLRHSERIIAANGDKMDCRRDNLSIRGSEDSDVGIPEEGGAQART